MPGIHCSDCGTPAPLIRWPKNRRQAAVGGWTCKNCGTELDRFGRPLDDRPRAGASDPGGLGCSEEKLAEIAPEFFAGASGFIRRLKERLGLEADLRRQITGHLRDGDSRAAVVVQTGPLLVAAYSDETDGVAILGFPDGFAERYGLREGARLLTINTYYRFDEPAADLIFGPEASGHWNGFYPIVAEFVSDDRDLIERRKRAIPAKEWDRALALGREYIARRPGVARDGHPFRSGFAAKV